MLKIVFISMCVYIVQSQTLLDIQEHRKGTERQMKYLAMTVRKQAYMLKNLAEQVEKLQGRDSLTEVYFHAWNSATLNNIRNGTTIVYDKVLTDKGEGYNQETGKFTAPRGGAYVFAWTAVTQDYHNINLHLSVNGTRISVAQADSLTGTQNSSGSNTVVVELKKGDIVNVVCGEWGATSRHRLHGHAHSTFSGWAI